MTQVGYYFFYIIQVQQAQHEMKEQLLAVIPESQLEDFVLEDNETNISWEERDKEFYFHNELYDVARIKVVDGKTHLLCMNDSKETKLLKHWEKILHPSGDHKNGKQSIKFQFPVYTIDSIAIVIKDIVRNNKFTPVFQVNLHTAFLDVSAPPPKA